MISWYNDIMMKRILITLTEEHNEWLREFGYAMKMSKAEIIRKLIDKEMKKTTEEK
jgi:hypothetical protein